MKPTFSNSLPLGLVLLTLSVAPVVADHGNPWAGPDDEVKSQFHDANQEKSLDRPGEDEMHGQTNRKVSPNAGRGVAGKANADAAGMGNGGGGHGFRDNGGGHGRGN
jgi:hypothetical protein